MQYLSNSKNYKIESKVEDNDDDETNAIEKLLHDNSIEIMSKVMRELYGPRTQEFTFVVWKLTQGKIKTFETFKNIDK